jgi:hypothetical protein
MTANRDRSFEIYRGLELVSDIRKQGTYINTNDASFKYTQIIAKCSDELRQNN